MSGDTDLLFPASEPEVISVAALQGDSSLWPESNRSKTLTCAFPGYGIARLAPSKSGLVKEADSGTSEACAVAASYIALYRGYSNRVSHYDIAKMLASLKTLSGKEADYVAPFDDLEDYE